MDRDELHHRVMLLKEEIEAGRLRFREGLGVIESLKKVRFAPDGKVDANTVDGLVRSLTLTVAFARFRREAKKIPLKESQVEYFEILEKFFGGPFSEMKKHRLSPPQVAEDLASNPRTVEAFQADAPEFAAGMKEFWEYYGPVVEVHLQDLGALKSVFGGDIFPSYLGNIATSVGLYVDTLILPDPLLRTTGFVGHMQPDRLLFFAAKHALNALQYRELALADVDPPIVVIAPDPSYIEDPYGPVLQLAGEADLLVHSAKLFGRTFATQQELHSFMDSVAEPREIVARISDPSRLLFDTEWSGRLEQQIERYAVEVGRDFTSGFEGKSIGEVIRFGMLGRMMQANDILFKASRLHGNPLIDAPTSWQYLLWKYEYDEARREPATKDVRDLLITKAISVEGSVKLGLLSGLPPEALIELRRTGAMSELRQLIRKGVQDVDSASQSSLAEVGEAVVTALCMAFAEHRKHLEGLSSEQKKFFGFDVSRWLGFGCLSIGAAAAGSPALAVLAASAGMIGAPRIDELRAQWKEIQSRKEELRRSPTGILFHHLKKK